MGEGVEFYLLKNFQITPEQCNVNASSAVLEGNPFVTNHDIKVYNTTNYEFTLTDKAIQQIQAFKDGMPYAVTVDKQVIYFAFFKPSYSSSICSPAILMDVRWSTDKICGTLSSKAKFLMIVVTMSNFFQHCLSRES